MLSNSKITADKEEARSVSVHHAIQDELDGGNQSLSMAAHCEAKLEKQGSIFSANICVPPM